MNFTTAHDIFCSLGVILIVYALTFPKWLRGHARERYLAAQETIEVMEAKLENYEKAKAIVGILEKDSEEQGTFQNSKEQLEFQLSLAKLLIDQNEIVLTANAKMKTAQEALTLCSEEMKQRAIETTLSVYFGGLALLFGLILFAIGK